MFSLSFCSLFCLQYRQPVFQEEEERKQRAAQQVEEGELLVANYRLEVDVDDAETTTRNKQRRYEAYVIT